MASPISYLQRDGVSIAYQVAGEEPLDLLVIPGAISHLALEWESPHWRRWCDRMVSFTRLIRFDKRGTGLSDRPHGPYTQEERMEDARAVLDAVGVTRAHVLATSEGGPLSGLNSGWVSPVPRSRILSSSWGSKTRIRHADTP